MITRLRLAFRLCAATTPLYAWEWLATAIALTLIALGLLGCGKPPSGVAAAGEQLGTAQVMEVLRVNAMRLDMPPLDSVYNTVTPDWVSGPLQAAIKAALPAYRVPTSDCDDFSRAGVHFATQMYGACNADAAPAYGQIVILQDDGGRHALNWFIAPGGALYFHEPQTGKVWLPTARETQGVLYTWI